MFLAWRMSKTQSRWQNQMAYVLFLKTNPIFSDENAFKISIINIMVGCNFWRFDANKFWMTDRKHEREVERGRCCGQQCMLFPEIVKLLPALFTGIPQHRQIHHRDSQDAPLPPPRETESGHLSPACTCCCDKTFFVYIPRDIESGDHWVIVLCLKTVTQAAVSPWPRD